MDDCVYRTWNGNCFGFCIGKSCREGNKKIRLISDGKNMGQVSCGKPVIFDGRKDMMKNIWKKSGVLLADRNYKLVHLLLMFFVFSVAGWLWEVMLSYVTEGSFVNRGVLHGPLLPIYGRGAILILILLKKIRKNPAAEFAGIILLSGCMEYFISWYLEMVYDGKRWWDYSDYWLNLNGRICAEGLILFGIGGMFVVYVAAPFLDDKLRKMNSRWLMVFAAALLVIYAGDSIYSAKYPNTGAGIKEYSANEESVCFSDL